ncbi:hypothetical protein [Metabacillus idriensis]|uniref:hypothetical protein n=1 Tax=Metabacillus idriensis TaxID=324768 RepID=UPI00174A8171|nr:hypothetical protein [Metabacillus idriensis]
MDIKEKIQKEMISFTCDFNFRVATVGTTVRESQPFAVLPRRKSLGYEAINFLVIDPTYAEECFKLLDGNVQYILVDIESKKTIDLMEIANKTVKKAKIVSYKPNDTTLEAADMFLRNYFRDNLKDKKVLIYGAGNLGSKLSLRLAERRARVYLDSRNKEKTKEIVNALNYLIPKYSKNHITAIQNYDELINEVDILIAFTSASNVISPLYSHYLKKHSLALDGGINNFTSDFIIEANRNSVACYRLDVRTAFPHSVLYLSSYTRDFYQNIQGESMIGNIRLVAGGIIGNEGDIVVDRIKDPKQIVGIANGIGGLKLESEYSDKERKNIERIKNTVLQS